MEEEWDEERDWLGQLTPGGTTKTGINSLAMRSAQMNLYIKLWLEGKAHCFASVVNIISNA